MLRVFVAGHCSPCLTAMAMVDRLRQARPQLPVFLIDVDSPGADVPGEVIGTPEYLWDDRVLFLGNPDEAELMAAVDREWAVGLEGGAE